MVLARYLFCTMKIDTTFLRRCIDSLEWAAQELEGHETREGFLYDTYRAACVKGFELVLEQSGKLLRKRIAVYFSNNRKADRLTFLEVFRYAVKHDLLDCEAVERWYGYRDNRNDTAHEYGEDFAETTLTLLPAFIEDAKALANMIDAAEDD